MKIMLQINKSEDSIYTPNFDKLSPKEYLQLVKKRIHNERLRTLKRIFSEESPYTISTEHKFLLTEANDIDECKKYLTEKGFTTNEAEDMIFTPDTKWNAENLKLFENHFNSAISTAKKCCQDRRLMDDKLAIGLADISLLNAGVGIVPSGGEYILFNHGVGMIPMWFATCRQVGEVYSQTTNFDVIFQHLVGYSAIALRIVNNWHVSGLNNFSHDLLFSEHMKYELQRGLWELAILFVILHEFGHIVLEHSDLLRKWGKISTWNNEEKQSRFQRMRKSEKEADIFAMELLVEKIKVQRFSKFNSKADIFSPMPHLEAICILFALFHVSESESDLKGSLNRTHPLSMTRLNNLLNHFANKYMAGTPYKNKFQNEDIPSIINNIKESRIYSRGSLKKSGVRILSDIGTVSFEV